MSIKYRLSDMSINVSSSSARRKFLISFKYWKTLSLTLFTEYYWVIYKNLKAIYDLILSQRIILNICHSKPLRNFKIQKFEKGGVLRWTNSINQTRSRKFFEKIKLVSSHTSINKITTTGSPRDFSPTLKFFKSIYFSSKYF